jgi:hypothetical protein
MPSVLPGGDRVSTETRDELEQYIAEAGEPFRRLLIWLDRGRPGRLCINGREYRRRLKARRRRKRVGA